ncbi:MAG: alkaline phosphatase D family protein [Vicinamibacterales bacterium]|nr:alkaline phosphatase D family protein [Vicinamibacterales bacterium]
MVNRRAFLLSGLALYGASARDLFAGPPARQSPRFSTTPFTLGVASGDPTSDGVVLWTRLAVDPLNGGGMGSQPVQVGWEIAADEQMSKVVKKGTVVASPEWAHAVHVEVSGLEPHRWYWYRFHAGNETSPIGRTRTFPAAQRAVDRLRFAFASCQHYEQGYFTAYDHMAKEDLDFVMHLGDYIYENPGLDNRVRKHVGPELMTVDDYRNRYAQYRSDPALQTAHAQYPWIVVWDDHEVDNNYASVYQENNAPFEAFAIRRANGYKAYYEHMPLRRTSVPRGTSLQLYRPFQFGALASIFMLDTRQFRSDQPCGDNVKPVCEGVRDPKATMLGAEQERWLMNGLDRSRTAWNLLGQQVMLSRLDRIAGPEQQFSMDKWDGYEVARKRLLDFLGTRKPRNPVTLAGDIHCNWVNDLRLDFDNPKSPIVATEFVGTSITSTGDGADQLPGYKIAASENEWVRFYNDQRGYVTCDLTPKQMRTDFKVLEYVTRPNSPIKTRASFVVEDGRTGAQEN